MGVLEKIIVAAGTEGVDVNVPIAILLEEGEDATAIAVSAASQRLTAENNSAETTKVERVAVVERPATPKPVFDADEPELGATTEITVREALRDAMAEEMRKDEAVFLMGEEVAEYQGRIQS